MKVFVFVLFGILFWQHAVARDVLFLDINNAIPEVQVVKERMDKDNSTGKGPESRLVIVPSYETYPLEKRRRIQELSAVMAGLKEKNILEPGGDHSRQIFNLGKVLRWHKTGNDKTDYSLNDFLPELETVLNNDSFDFDRVFVSGHHGSDYGSMNAVIGGEFFNGLTVDTLKTMLNKSLTTKNVNSIILLGCKTAINKLMEREGIAWAGVLPGSLLQFGFNETSPVKTDELNLSILREVTEVQDLIGRYKNDPDSKITQDIILQRLFKIKRGNRYLGFRFNNTYYQYPEHFVE